jgi:hypothetical protein
MSEVSRRAVLRTAVAGVVGLGCLRLGGLREALAQSKATGKPLLTEGNVNAFIEHAFKDKVAFRSHAALAKENLLAFVDRYFTLTEHQRLVLTKMYSPTPKARLAKSEFVRGVDLALEKEVPIVVKIGNPDTPSLKKDDVRVGIRGNSDGVKLVHVQVEFDY